ncbi:MAG: YaaR family protein [Oscillospiraceae bacterium]|jgi:uncharacterized protein YaaR (DUF327 family)|nr:YaaR family protein [Oscillospiraceae bacterium]
MNVKQIKNASAPATGTSVQFKAAAATHGVEFRRTLSTLSGQVRDELLQGMINNIDELGRKLSEQVNMADFARYRALIKQFLDDVISNGYELERKNSFDGRGRHRFHVTVKRINEKLDELGREILTEQADNLSVLSAVDDIRGLIVDIMT